MPISVKEYARFCAPTVYAALTGATNLEAAEVLEAGGFHDGYGATQRWGSALADLGGVHSRPHDPEGGRRYDEACDAWYAGRRCTLPSYTLKMYTVAGFLRAHPKGLYVISTTRHTLIARDGEVIVDTMHTKSARARVHFVHRFPDDLEISA